MKQIRLEYPYESGNDLWDGKEHVIIPNDLFEFQINGNTYYVMPYRDETYNEDDVITILSLDENGNFVKSPLDDYSRLNELLNNVELSPVDIDLLPDEIPLGNRIEIDTLINPNKKENDYSNYEIGTLERENNIGTIQKPQEFGNGNAIPKPHDNLGDGHAIPKPQDFGNGNIVYNPNELKPEFEMKPPQMEGLSDPSDLPRIKAPINQIKYPAFVEDNEHCFIYRDIFDTYLSDLYDVLPRTTRIDNHECILIRNTDNDIIYERSEHGLVAEYVDRRIYARTGINPNDDDPKPEKEEGIIMDYPNMNDYPNLPNNRLWDGRTHSITPVSLQMFELAGRTFYFMNYYDNDYNCECITLLGEDELGNIVKIPLDYYDKLPELLSRVNLFDVSLNKLPNHIRLGQLMEIDYLIGLTNRLENGFGGFGDTPPNKSTSGSGGGGDTPPDDPSINVKEEKFSGKQALFTVFRGLDGTLRVDAVEYEFYLNDLLEKETHPVVKGKVILTEYDLEYIYNNSKNPELMPDFEIEYSEYNTRTMDIDNFNVYITNDGLELDTYDYTKFVELGLLEEREVIDKRVKITKEEIHNIENYDGEWHYYAKLVNEIKLKPEVAFTIYNVNAKHFEVTNNIYDRYLKKYLEPNNKKERHGGWNENGDYFTVITEEDIKTIERESNSPKLTPTILYKERKKRDIYGNYVDDNTNDIDKVENNQQIIDNPPIKKRNKVKSMVKNTMDWAKEHPLLATIAVGLAVTLGSQLALSGVMMLNSTLWSVLGGTGSACAKLHSINMALSKIVGFGAFKFTEAGTYALAGKTGALALYSGVGAKLTSAVLGLTGIGGLGKLIANKIRKNKEKENEIETPENNNKKSNENNKQETTLTREQIAELVKQEVEKATEGLVKENKALKAENESLRQQIEELLSEQELSATRTK